MTSKTSITIAEMKKDIDYIKNELGEVKSELHNFINCADKRYASKTVEKIVYGAVGFVLFAVLGAVMFLIGLKNV